MSYVYWQDRADNLSVFANLMIMDTDTGMEASMEKRYVDPDIAYTTAQSAIPDGYHLSAYSYASAHSPNYWFAFHDDRLFRQDVVITGHQLRASPTDDKGDGMKVVTYSYGILLWRDRWFFDDVFWLCNDGMAFIRHLDLRKQPTSRPQYSPSTPPPKNRT